MSVTFKLSATICDPAYFQFWVIRVHKYEFFSGTFWHKVKQKLQGQKSSRKFYFSAIGTKLDNFCLRDPRVLDWSSRRWRVLEEVLQHRPDVITLQEVDHFSFLAPALASVGYCGRYENVQLA